MENSPTFSVNSFPFSSNSPAQTGPNIHIPALSLLAHARYGHMCGRKLNELVTLQAAKGLLLSRTHPSHKCLLKACDACVSAKMSRLKFGTSRDHQVKFPNDMASADVCCPIAVFVNKEGVEEI